jgi:plasmid stabilization system protein ParE
VISTGYSTGFPKIAPPQPPNCFGVSSFASIGSLLPALRIWPGLVEGTRELLETPYIIVYSVDEAAGAIELIAIVHGARDRQA